MQIVDLSPDHAATAAHLHIAGQPGTFLTSLGQDVLTVLYQSLPQTSVGFGYVATVDEPASRAQHRSNPSSVIGFVAATTSTGRLFLDLGTRHLVRFLPPLFHRLRQRPRLLLQLMQTALYPILQDNNEHGSGNSTPAAELLAIMVEPTQRNQQIGSQLLAQLVAACQSRNIATIDVTVDANNVGACRFYEHHGFRRQHAFPLYGRTMYQYRREITT